MKTTDAQRRKDRIADAIVREMLAADHDIKSVVDAALGAMDRSLTLGTVEFALMALRPEPSDVLIFHTDLALGEDQLREARQLLIAQMPPGLGAPLILTRGFKCLGIGR